VANRGQEGPPAQFGDNRVSVATGTLTVQSGYLLGRGRQVFLDRTWRCEQRSGLPFNPDEADDVELSLVTWEESEGSEVFLSAHLGLLSWGGAVRIGRMRLDAGSGVLYSQGVEDLYVLSVKQIEESIPG